MRKVKDAIDLKTGEKVYFRGHAQATYMSDGRTVEEAVKSGGGGSYDDTEIKEDISELQQKDAQTDTKLTELSQDLYTIESSIQTNENDKLYIVDANGNILAEFNRDGLRVVSIATQLHYEIEDGYNGLRIVDANGNIIVSIGGNGVEFAGQDEFVKNALLEYYSKKNTAAICWVDDDFVYSAHRAIYERMREFCISKNIRVDLAVGILYDTNLEQAKKWEEEGFDFLLHPQHDGWYDDPNVGYEHDITKVKKSFVQAARFHMTNFINKRNILIYPGSSNNYADNVEYIKDYVECAITATYYGSNHSNIENRYQLKRMSISPSADNTKSKIKARIKDAVANGDWIILYTHIYNFQNTDVVDETSNSFANMCEIVEYANSLCPITHTQSIWEDRKKIYNFKK